MFPYISQIKVNNCFVQRDISIPKFPLESFRHIVLTGKNGSGKTSVLNGVAFQLGLIRSGIAPADEISKLKAWASNKQDTRYAQWVERIDDLRRVDLIVQGGNIQPLVEGKEAYVFAHFRANREIKFNPITNISREIDFEKSINDFGQVDQFAKELNQYLVHKKITTAIQAQEGNFHESVRDDDFFTRIQELLRRILQDDKALLMFESREFQFYIKKSGGLQYSINHLSAGYSAFMSNVIELLIREDILRKNHHDWDIKPFGIVVLDEPETHFHLSMQYEIMPILTNLFPKFQFIVATHSPAVLSSIDNAVIYDLSTLSEIQDQPLGSSYSDLMLNHFGVTDEFGPIADEIMSKVLSAIHRESKADLREVLAKYEKYLTPSLRIEIESRLINSGEYL